MAGWLTVSLPTQNVVFFHTPIKPVKGGGESAVRGGALAPVVIKELEVSHARVAEGVNADAMKPDRSSTLLQTFIAYYRLLSIAWNLGLSCHSAQQASMLT